MMMEEMRGGVRSEKVSRVVREKARRMVVTVKLGKRRATFTLMMVFTLDSSWFFLFHFICIIQMNFSLRTSMLLLFISDSVGCCMTTKEKLF